MTMSRPDFWVQRVRGTEDRMATYPSGAVIKSVDTRTSTVQWSFGRGDQPSPISHPYMGPTSWIRVAPERGTKIVVGYQAPNMEPYIASYATNNIPGASVDSLIEATEAGKFYYRQLKEGEIQITSSGLADVSWLNSGTLSLRGGSVTMRLDNDRLELSQRAPTYIRATLGNTRLAVGNEERFGVITRQSTQDASQQVPVTIQGEFGKEYLRHIQMPDARTALVDHREGIVVEDNGVPAVMNGSRVRVRSRYGTTSDEVVELAMDESGNTYLTIPQGATTGLTVTTERTDMTFEVGKNWSVVVDQSVTWNVQRDIDIQAQSVSITGNKRLATQDFSNTLQGVIPLTPATNTGDVVAAFNATLAWLKTLPNGYTTSLTSKVTAS